MPFDLSEMDTLTHAEAGVAMPLIHIRTRVPILDDDGTPLTITLAGRQSETFRDVLKMIQARRGEHMNRTGGTVDSDAKEREDIDILVACTLGWTLKILDRAPFPCTPQNIRKLWHDARFRPLREQAMSFLLTDANFLAPISEPSADTLGISSLSVVHSPAAAETLPTPSRASG